jgi:O-acetyl-ADP-ribose deacetylase (regulator of RNase III)
METIVKDILTVDQGIIVHQVNTSGLMGAGIALQIRTKWPIVYSDYADICEKGARVGDVLFSCVGHRLVVASLFGQQNVGRGKRQTDYTAYATGLPAINQFAKDNNLKVYFPLGIGCGLAGGRWDYVEPMIKHYVPDAIICKLLDHIKRVNISSYSGGGIAALTNPTELAAKKKKISKHYPVLFNSTVYADAEQAYQTEKYNVENNHAAREDLMTEIITAKLRQYYDLVGFITKQGGLAWLEVATHLVTRKPNPWEGVGNDSAFIRCLTKAYKNAQTLGPDVKEITTVANLYKSEYDVYIGRAGKGQDGYFGNPHPVGKPCPICGITHKKGDAAKAYQETFDARIEVDPIFRRRIHALKGKVLGCFCKPGPCHGDVIANYLNSLED